MTTFFDPDSDSDWKRNEDLWSKSEPESLGSYIYFVQRGDQGCV